jgi:hypothetical protein
MSGGVKSGDLICQRYFEIIRCPNNSDQFTYIGPLLASYVTRCSFSRTEAGVYSQHLTTTGAHIAALLLEYGLSSEIATLYNSVAFVMKWLITPAYTSFVFALWWELWHVWYIKCKTVGYKWVEEERRETKALEKIY